MSACSHALSSVSGKAALDRDGDGTTGRGHTARAAFSATLGATGEGSSSSLIVQAGKNCRLFLLAGAAAAVHVLFAASAGCALRGLSASLSVEPCLAWIHVAVGLFGCAGAAVQAAGLGAKFSLPPLSSPSARQHLRMERESIDCHGMKNGLGLLCER